MLHPRSGRLRPTTSTTILMASFASVRRAVSLFVGGIHAHAEHPREHATAVRDGFEGGFGQGSTVNAPGLTGVDGTSVSRTVTL
jgi:hypothetical protein